MCWRRAPRPARRWRRRGLGELRDPLPAGGFPILVPGQEVSLDILDVMDALVTKEIHGLDPARGYQVLSPAGSAPLG